MNRLQHETSPYLLQHAHNPVDWYPWGPEAFERARIEQKPMLVSIGYSTCHWCHVMERESFEDADVAALMNEHFINIKVDREERPDIDAIYMEACQILTGGGGWPLNCFLTPERKPFYAGTYFPPRPAYGRPSWPQLLLHLSQIWAEKRDTALEQAERLTSHIRKNDDILVVEDIVPASASAHAPAAIFTRMREQFDRQDGGFGGAPKFPGTMAIQFLLDFYAHSGNQEALEHALFSLEQMIQGGIYDQLGGGFARYATDKAWLVPHFEKMLYDNALLISVLADAYKITAAICTQNAPTNTQQRQRQAHLFKETIEETLSFIEREMTSPEGGFYSALDADTEGEEGKYYVWQIQEVEQVLMEDASLFCAFYDVTTHGNWEGKNILHRPQSYEAFAADIHQDVDALKQQLVLSRTLLLKERQKRIAPGLDDKVLLSWNALMVSAYAAAYTALRHEPYRQAAVRNVEMLLEQFSQGPALRHSLSQQDAFLDDYAYLIAALIDLYQITFEVRYLHLAERYLDFTLEIFLDQPSGLFYFTQAGQADILVRRKDLYDNATPSGNSTMVYNLQRLSILLDQPYWQEIARQMLSNMQPTVERFPLSFERWATALLHQVSASRQIVVVGNNAVEKALDLQQQFLPNSVIAAGQRPSDELPLLKDKAGSSDAYIYVCKDYSCQRPVVSVEEAAALLLT